MSYPEPVNGVLACVGAGLLANAAWMVGQRLSAQGAATGQVVDHEATTTPGAVDAIGPPTTLYSPVVEFTTGGRRHRFTAIGGDTKRRPARGTRLPVRFRPGHPEAAYVATFATMWVMPIVWGLAGMVALAIALTP